MSGASELEEDIKKIKKVHRDYQYDEDGDLLLELVSHIQKLLELADLLVIMLHEEEIEDQKAEQEKIDKELITSESMLLKGIEMIQKAMSIQKNESDIIFGSLILSNADITKAKHDIYKMYTQFNCAPNSIIDSYIQDKK